MSQDFWKITFEERTKHNLTFNSLNPEQGLYLNGEQAKNFMLKSGLAPSILAEIWNLSDMNKDGRLDRKEFSIACSLIKKVLTTGCKLPPILPSSILVEPTDRSTPSPTLSISPQNVNNVVVNRSLSNNIGFTSSTPISIPPTSISSGIPPIPPTSRNKYTQVFQSNDTSQTGFMAGQQAKNLLLKTGLPQHVLAQIWTLSDFDTDGKLSLEEFIIAMHLCDYSKTSASSAVLPSTLPAELQPKQQRANSLTSQGTADLINEQFNQLNVSPPKQSLASFEDKRRENFDKGNAVLEAKRRALIEQAEREKREREEKDRIEQEKRQKIREEQERRRLAELERQAERQRQLEHQREEERKKIFEQREVARQELLRQQRIEWERQKKQELETQKVRLQEQLSVFKGKDKNIEYDMQQLNEKISSSRVKIDDTRANINQVTKVYESNKILLDKKICECDLIERQIKELNDGSRHLSNERSLLMEKAKIINQDSPFSESYRNELNVLKQEQATLAQNKLENDRLEQDINSMRTQIECLRHELEVSKQEIFDLNRENDQISSILTVKRNDFRTNSNRSQTPKETYDAFKEEIEKLTSSVAAATITIYSNPIDSFKITTPATTTTTTTTTTNDENALDTNNEQYSPIKHNIENKIKNNLSSTSNADQWSHQQESPQEQQSHEETIDFNVDWSNAFNDNQSASLVVDPFANEPDPFVDKNHDPFAATVQSNNFDAFWSSSNQTQDPFATPTSNDTFGATTEIFKNDKNWGLDDQQAIKASDSTNWAAFEDAFKATLNKNESSTKNNTSSHLIKFKVLYNYEAQQSDEITLNEGDVVLVDLSKKTDDGWSWAECNGRQGVFPTAFGIKVSDLDNRLRIIQEEYANAETEQTASIPLKNGMNKKEANGVKSSGPVSLSGKKVITIAAYTAKKDNHLSFQKDEIITVREEQQGVWWSGELNGKIGWFPKDYVKDLTTESQTRSKQLKNYFISFFAFESNEPGDLNFGRFELIEVIEMNGEWFTGCIEQSNTKQKITGIFPSNYVVKFNFPDEVIAKNNFAIVLLDYMARSSEELDLVVNEFVSIDQVSSDLQWILAEKYDDLSKEHKKGWIPAAHVDKIILTKNIFNAENFNVALGASTITTTAHTANADTSLSSNSSSTLSKDNNNGHYPKFQQKLTRTNSLNKSLDTTATLLTNQKELIQQQQQQTSQTVIKRKSIVIDKVVALYDFQATTPEAISFPKDAVIDIINKDGDWWTGEYNNQSGLLPYNYVQSIGHRVSSLKKNDSSL